MRYLISAVLLSIILIFILINLPKINSQSFQTNITSPSSSISSIKIPNFSHIVLIIMENKPLSSLQNNPSASYINQLAKQYAYANNYSAVTNPSLPNYLALIGGSTFGIKSDCTNCFLNKTNLVDRLQTSHISWKAYMESMPHSCYIGSTNLYAQKHDPFIYFDDIRKNPARCNNIVPYAYLKSDLTSISPPQFIWITPNICNDMHNCSIQTGDTWLSKNIPNLLKSPIFTQENSLLIITWDEGNIYNNQIATILIGPQVKKGYISNQEYTHYSLLHTIESSWNLQPLTSNDATSPVMSDFFNK